jgi:DNA helicase-4
VRGLPTFDDPNLIVGAEGFSDAGVYRLRDDLTRLGIKLDWNPDRPKPGAKALEHEDLARLVRTFMTHVKSNSLTPELLKQRISSGPQSFRAMRNQWFVNLYWQIHEEWQARLDADGSIDFEDMLVRAAEHLEAGDISSRYALILVDELQDASQARARLVRALVSHRDRYLLAVGDDWQSINRFAGADMSVMTEFEAWFGRTQTLRLQTTFRCPQTICDVTSAFVSKNPGQIRKEVKSAQPSSGRPVKVLYVEDRTDVPAAIEEYLNELATADADDNRLETKADHRMTVNVLGRYRHDQNLVPKRTPRGLDVTFRTVHSSKGLEADYIVIPNVANGQYGFPSQIADDPVLDIVMPRPDKFPHAEERRLFYVALTRAKHEVVLVAVRGRESPFIVELAQQAEVGRVVFDDGDLDLAPSPCPRCSRGMLIERSGPHGEFYGCSRFPACSYKENAAWSLQRGWESKQRSRTLNENPF